MPEPIELSAEDCERLLSGGVVGRVALSTPDGPHIVPVNYSVHEGTIVMRTTSYSVLGTHGRDAMLAFEVDHLDYDRHVGWSVVARGRSRVETDPDELAAIRGSWEPRPWASGSRNLCLRLAWEQLSGRTLGSDWTRANESEVHRTLTTL